VKPDDCPGTTRSGAANALDDPAPPGSCGATLVRSAGAGRGPAVPAVIWREAMTASPPPVPVQVPKSSWGAGRIVALVLGVLLLFPGLGLLAGGGALLWADSTHRTSDGYLTSDAGTFRTSGFALTSERLDLSTGADWVPVSKTLGTARFEVTGTDPDADVFIGIASASDVAGYLDGVQRTVVDDLGNGASAGTQVDGGPPSGPPGDQTFWTAQASGSGTQQLTWRPASGDWALVVMNTDGSADVSVIGTAGATVPSLSGLAWGLLIVGGLVSIIGVLLIVLAARRGSRRTGPPTTYPAGPAGGPPQAWGPPTPREPAEGSPAREAQP
jgi:hypothetical protein